MVQDNNTEDGVQNEKQPAWKNVNRDRGILTQEDRKYLLGKKEVSGQDERNTRYRIRQRFINSILDLGFIHKLGEDDTYQIMSDERLLDGSVRLSSASLLALLARYEHPDDLNETESEIESVLQESLTVIPSDERLKLLSGEPEQVRLTDVVGTVSIELKVAEPDIEKYVAEAYGYESREQLPSDEKERKRLISKFISRGLDMDVTEDDFELKPPKYSKYPAEDNSDKS